MAYLIAGIAIYLAVRFKKQRDQYRAEGEWLRGNRARTVNPTTKIDVVL